VVERQVLPQGIAATRHCPVCGYRALAKSDVETVCAVSDHFLYTKHHLQHEQHEQQP
jgi:hypothetical protein